MTGKAVLSLSLMSLLTFINTLENNEFENNTTFINKQSFESPILSPCQCSMTSNLIQKDGWFLAFRMTAGINRPAYDTWIATGKNDDDPLVRASLPSGCLSTDTLYCDRHYRSKLVDLWPSEIIHKVRVALYEGGNETAYVTFNGSYSSRDSWFAKERVLESSWTDLMSSDTNIFSIMGDTVNVKRRFYINNVYPGCAKDLGWLVVKDVEEDVCTWANVPPYSAILFSPTSSKINWNFSRKLGSLFTNGHVTFEKASYPLFPVCDIRGKLFNADCSCVERNGSFKICEPCRRPGDMGRVQMICKDTIPSPRSRSNDL